LLEGFQPLDVAPALLRHPAADDVRDAYDLAPLPPDARVADGSRWRLWIELPDAMAEAAAGGGRTEPWGRHAVKEGLPVPDDWTARDRDVLRALGWVDPRPAASALFAKTSVTEWKRRMLEEELEEAEAPFAAAGPSEATGGKAGGSPAFAGAAVAKRPRFLAKRGLTPVERGVAYHAVMQHLRLSRELSTADVESLLSDMVLRELLTEEQRAAVDVESVRRFAESEPGLRLARADKTHRELPFSVGLPAAEVYGEAPHGVPLDAETAAETVLVQGIIDCLFEDERGLAIVDYKTDAIRGETGLDELTERYRLQLSVYAKAAEKALGRPVTDRYLYFFDGARAVKL